LFVRFTIAEPVKGLSQGIEAGSKPPKFIETVKLLWSKRSFRHLALATALQSMVGYSIISWLPSYMIRLHGMGTGEVGTWLALSAGIAGAIGTFGGGWLADHLASRDRRFYQWVPAIAAALLVPLMCMVMLAANPAIAMLIFILPALLQNVCIGPSLASTHALVDVRSKSVGSAILFFVVNLIGLGLGPLSIGIISDFLEPTYGNESLRWALLSGVLLVGTWSATHFVLGARTFREDSAQQASSQTRLSE
jgi:MFS family permease